MTLELMVVGRKTSACWSNWNLQDYPQTVCYSAFEYFVEFNNSGRTSGHSLKLRKQRCHLDLRLHFFSVINLRNNQTVSASSLNCF